MQLYIQHSSRYRYAEQVSYSIQHLRLTPRHDPCQTILDWQISAPGQLRAQRDAHGNLMHTLTITAPHNEIPIVVEGVVETLNAPILLPRGETLSPLAYLAPSPLATADEAIRAFARNAAGTADTMRAQVLRLMAAVSEIINYVPGSTEVYHNAAEVFAQQRGVCQDQAHVFIAACRTVGIPARYVSGYIHTEHEHTASHAWADVWLADEAGWLACDITHNRLAYDCFCRLAVARDYLDASPIRGMRRGGNGEILDVSVRVTDSHEAARQMVQQ